MAKEIGSTKRSLDYPGNIWRYLAIYKERIKEHECSNCYCLKLSLHCIDFQMVFLLQPERLK